MLRGSSQGEVEQHRLETESHSRAVVAAAASSPHRPSRLSAAIPASPPLPRFLPRPPQIDIRRQPERPDARLPQGHRCAPAGQTRAGACSCLPPACLWLLLESASAAATPLANNERGRAWAGSHAPLASPPPPPT